MVRKLTRKRFAIVLSVVLVGLVCFEVYAHIYVQVDTLPVVTSDYALSSTPIINDTCTFSSNGAKWLLILALPVLGGVRSNTGVAEIFVFKTQENKSFFTQSVDLVGVKFDVKSTPLGIESLNTFGFDLYGSNCTLAYGQYIMTASGNYHVDFRFTFKVYEKTLIGILAVDETTIHFNQTMAIPI
ncbi:MAG: hypothetical protein ABSC91_04810 [Candidatus Bathyarchaeia archaeon]|jgi:hypothetical protein